MIEWLRQAAVETGHIALEMAPYVVIGLIAAVIVYAVFPAERIQKWLGKRGIWSAFKAALAGIPMPLCSCGVVPVALSLKKQGASDGATVSFLVSEPETGPDSIAVTYALINLPMTIIRPIAGIISAVATGLAVERWGARSALRDHGHGHREEVECATCGLPETGHRHGGKERLRSSFKHVANEFWPDIANWLVIGIVISGVLAVLIPANWFAELSSFGQMAMAVIVGIPLYICASASTPIAAVFLAKGMSPGAALVFLLVGPATNAASFLVIMRMLGVRRSVVYIIGLIVSSILIGLLVNAFMGSWDWTPKIADAAHGEHIGAFHWVGLILLSGALVYVWLRKFWVWRRRIRFSDVAQAS